MDPKTDDVDVDVDVGVVALWWRWCEGARRGARKLQLSC